MRIYVFGLVTWDSFWGLLFKALHFWPCIWGHHIWGFLFGSLCLWPCVWIFAFGSLCLGLNVWGCGMEISPCRGLSMLDPCFGVLFFFLCLGLCVSGFRLRLKGFEFMSRAYYLRSLFWGFVFEAPF